MNYKDVFQLAESKGYECIPSEYVTTHLVLCDIKKWLRDAHGIDIEINNQFTSAKEGKWYFPCIYSNVRKVLSTNQGTSYESALLTGIKEALQLI